MIFIWAWYVLSWSVFVAAVASDKPYLAASSILVFVVWVALLWNKDINESSGKS